MSPLKFFLLLVFAPEFIARRPKNNPGIYKASVFSASPWYRQTRFESDFDGARTAYYVARWEAFKLHFGGVVAPECAIMWSVSKATP